MGKIIHIDIGRCINCRSCEVACAREHQGCSLISVIPVDESCAVPINCRHCERAPCASICPTKALLRTPGGSIVVDAAKCNGCKFCLLACPFGIIQYDPVSKIVRMCDLCQGRLKEGKVPACVATCPAGALVYDEFQTVMERFRKRAAKSIVGGRELPLGFFLKDPPRVDFDSLRDPSSLPPEGEAPPKGEETA